MLDAELSIANPRSRMDITGNFQRSNRPKLRALMSEGVDLRMDRAFERYELIDGGVRAYFKNGSTYTGRFLIGCEGAVSGGAALVPVTAACVALMLFFLIHNSAEAARRRGRCTALPQVHLACCCADAYTRGGRARPSH